MLTISVEDRAVAAYLQQLQDRLSDLTPVMSEIGAALEGNILQRFETRTDPSGAAWKPWAPSTREGYPFAKSKSASRAKYGAGNARLLDRYGTMLQSLNHQADGHSVTIGFATDYAAFHEYGTQNMPRRGMLMADPDQGTLGEDDEATVLDIITYWLSEGYEG